MWGVYLLEHAVDREVHVAPTEEVHDFDGLCSCAPSIRIGERIDGRDLFGAPYFLIVHEAFEEGS